jgi:hypothetical protein
MSHIAGILQRQEGPVSEQALADCVNTILREYQTVNVEDSNDLLAFQKRLRERKGIKG